MPVFDLREYDSHDPIETDICVVGSGPAAMSLVKEFLGTTVQICILESGGFEEEEETQALYNIESIGFPRVIDQSLVRNRILGGSSHTWYGRCAPLDDLDFQKRSWVPYSGWPISSEEIKPYEKRAHEVLGLGSDLYESQAFKALKIQTKKRFNPKLLRDQFWQYSKVSSQNREPMRFGNYKNVQNAANVKIFLHSNLTHINTDPMCKKVESCDVCTIEGKSIQVKAKKIVICCGGIENARILLASNKIVNAGVGNQNDMVGRFLMDHPGATIGEFKSPLDSYKVQNYIGGRWLKNKKGRHVYDHGIALSPDIQEKEGLLNCAAFLLPVGDENDPVFLIRRLRNELKKNISSLNTLIEIFDLTLNHSQELISSFYRNFFKNRPAVESSQFYCLVEQAPNPNSRVTLSTVKDSLGIPISTVDWRISGREVQTARRLGELIHQEFGRLGMPQPIVPSWLSKKENWDIHIQDRAHPIGTTRMSKSPKDGVVDVNCQVHDIEGLFVLGSSVFPTSGHVNPTLTIAALGIRLADHLKLII